MNGQSSIRGPSRGTNARRAVAITAFAGLAVASAQAETVFGFSLVPQVPPNGNVNVESQFTMTVMDDEGNGTVRFKFINAGAIACAVSEIYFEDGTLLQMPPSIAQSDSNFQLGGNLPNPGNPPGINPFDASGLFSADAVGNPGLGLNPGEEVIFTFALQGDKNYADTLQAIYDGFDGRDGSLEDGFTSLRIAFHVRGINGGDPDNDDFSDSFIMTPIPLPSAVAMSAIGCLVIARRRRSIL